jgi:transcriptional regulator with XRE-family HTH domain
MIEMPLAENFRTNLRRRRRELRLSQDELGARLNVTGPYVSQVEAGRTTPGLDVVERFAKALECPGVALLLDPEEALVG